MNKRFNKTFELLLDTEKGVLQLNGLFVDKEKYLYDDHGNLQAKHGAYVLVLLHPVCEVAVRRFIY